MEQIAVRELNQHTSRVLARVRAGETVEVTDRGEPIARLVPVLAGDALLGRMVAEGRATAPTTTGPLPMPPVLGDPSMDVAAVLAESRDEERW
ncbi:type II toxin-antitoxin system prevent-host-death family antitoxin [Micromonospora sp. WMMA1998]|uniref:type II toxin-antitoxin system Phd/YefM family antitoxin n=1 Tax=Micromonospora sp. WMMA1998 TaxID=3015167 RepID=UPI00248CBB71|nr:type II toxin-antitoxin system prevent-host-death family antitoxin [Micromonospora sp. WMMA1998]WBC13537.1 type II toxin-antitoxin system prevent-host-death family antitoxin [Micromonospora sp. WMMA1998]